MIKEFSTNLSKVNVFFIFFCPGVVLVHTQTQSKSLKQCQFDREAYAISSDMGVGRMTLRGLGRTTSPRK